MLKTTAFVGLACWCIACSGDDPYKPEFSTREATATECANGGSVLLVDGTQQAVVCDGADGTAGPMGADGAPGPAGADAANGVAGAGSSIIGTASCSGGYPPTNTESYINVSYTDFSDGEAIGLCTLTRPGGILADVSSVLSGTRLSCLLTDAAIDDIVSVDISALTVKTLAGALLSDLNCTLYNTAGGYR